MVHHQLARGSAKETFYKWLVFRQHARPRAILARRWEDEDEKIARVTGMSVAGIRAVLRTP
jgi:hypothetical protein